MRGRCPISPKKRAPRNAKNKRGRFDLGDLPVEMSEEYEFDVVDMSPNGEGIAKIGGFLIFIAGAKARDCPYVNPTATSKIAP